MAAGGGSAIDPIHQFVISPVFHAGPVTITNSSLFMIIVLAVISFIMIIGVSAVITMVALGTGASASIETQIRSAGTNMIMVMAGNFQQGGVRMGQGNASTLTPDDALAIRDVPGVQYAAQLR